MTVRFYPSGVVVFAVFCTLLGMALSDPAWTHVAEAVATVIIALMIAGFVFPSLLRKSRGL